MRLCSASKTKKKQKKKFKLLDLREQEPRVEREIVKEIARTFFFALCVCIVVKDAMCVVVFGLRDVV